MGREDLIEKQFSAPGSEAHAEVEQVFLTRTRDEWTEFASQHDCCLEPVLGLDEALDSELVRAREMVVRIDQPGTDGVDLLGVPVKLSRTPGTPAGPGPALGEHTREVLAAAGYSDDGDRRAARVGGGRRGGKRGARELPVVSQNGLLKMKELADASGVSAGTIKHYLREGLLGDGNGVVKTSRNMAYYPPEFVERIKLIKQLQEERFMPLKVIKAMLDRDPERAQVLVELEDRILERALAGERKRVSAAELRRRLGVPQEVLDRLAKLEVITPSSRGYGQRDVEIVEAISRFRAGGYDERIGFTVYDTLRYKRALEELVKEEVQVLMDRLAGELEPDRAADLIAAGVEPLNDLIAALHQKSLVAELRRQRAARG